MKFNGALVQLEDMVIAVAVDSADFLSLPQEEKMAKMRAYQSAFPKTPFVMLLDMGAGESEFSGVPIWWRKCGMCRLIILPLKFTKQKRINHE